MRIIFNLPSPLYLNIIEYTTLANLARFFLNDFQQKYTPSELDETVFYMIDKTETILSEIGLFLKYNKNDIDFFTDFLLGDYSYLESLAYWYRNTKKEENVYTIIYDHIYKKYGMYEFTSLTTDDDDYIETEEDESVYDHEFYKNERLKQEDEITMPRY